MEKEKLGEELTEKISGGTLSKIREHIDNSPAKIGIMCAKCGEKFFAAAYGDLIHYSDLSEIRRMNIAWRTERCICPKCGYANPESSSIIKYR